MVGQCGGLVFLKEKQTLRIKQTEEMLFALIRNIRFVLVHSFASKHPSLVVNLSKCISILSNISFVVQEGKKGQSEYEMILPGYFIAYVATSVSHSSTNKSSKND